MEAERGLQEAKMATNWPPKAKHFTYEETPFRGAHL